MLIFTCHTPSIKTLEKVVNSLSWAYNFFWAKRGDNKSSNEVYLNIFILNV